MAYQATRTCFEIQTVAVICRLKSLHRAIALDLELSVCVVDVASASVEEEPGFTVLMCANV